MTTVSAPPTIHSTLFTGARGADGTMPFRNLGVLEGLVSASWGTMKGGDPVSIDQRVYSAQSPADPVIEQAIDGYTAALAALKTDPTADPAITPKTMTVLISNGDDERAAVHPFPIGAKAAPAVRQAAAAAELLFNLVKARGVAA